MTAAFDRSRALQGARASAAAYELDDGKRRALLGAASLQELGFLQGRSDARLLVVETMAGEIWWVFQGTQFTRREWPSILANLTETPQDVGDGRRVMSGYWRQLEALMPFLAELPAPDGMLGHSMGGTIAHLAANLLPLPRLPWLMTYGAPCCADAAFWAAAKVLPVRIIHESDPAPRWPLTGPYVQPGLAWWLHAGGIALSDHRPSLLDLVRSWGDHDENAYIAALEALPA